MSRDFRLFWSSIENYESCPQKFLWSRGFGTIDLGAGPGRPKPILERKSEHHALMGTVLSYVIERLYNDELWKDPTKLADTLLKIVEREFVFELGKRYIKWSGTPSNPKWDESPPREELIQTCKDGILGFLRTMKRNRLLGPYARSEVDLSGYVNKYTPIGGRPDIVIRRDDNGLRILDGKNSKNPGRWTNPDQLRWYALCFFLAYHTLPDSLAFIYFRYPESEPPEEYGDPAVPWTSPKEEWTGLVDVPFTKDDLKILAERAVQTHRAIMKGIFDPTPSPKVCRVCDFQDQCDARIDQKLARVRKPKTEAEKAIADADGFVDLSLSHSPPRKQ